MNWDNAIEVWEEFLNKRNKAEDPDPAPEEPEEEIIDVIEDDPVAEREAPIYETAAFNSITHIALSGTDKNKLSDEITKALTFIMPDHRTYKITIETI